MDLMIAHYRAELSDSGYRARVRIDFQSKGTTKQVEYTHPHEFREMNDALRKGFELIRRWHARHAPQSDLVIEP